MEPFPLSILLVLLAVVLATVEAEPSLLRKNNNNNKASPPATLIATQNHPHHHHHLDHNNNSTGCARLGQLPEECHCHEPGHHQLKIECLKQFSSMLFNDTIGLLIDLDPCNADGSRLNVDLVELNHNIHYTVAGISAGDEEDYPIPGLAVVVPGIGNIGMDLAVLMEGNLDMLEIKLGLDACIALPSHQVCAESIPGLNMILPWYVLSGNYTFSDVCEQDDDKQEQQQQQQAASAAMTPQNLLLPSQKTTRALITNGQPVTLGSYPFFAYNKVGTSAGCGATLIHDDILLTAAHCLPAFAGRGAYVGAETNFGLEGDQVEFHEDETYVVHPEYNASNLVNDIMVVKLQTPSTLPLVTLNRDPTTRITGIPMQVIGFGDTEFRGALSPDLLETEVIGFAFETCVRVHLEIDPTVTFDRAAQFCAMGTEGRDSCDGDSGGPILIMDENNDVTQVGIISSGLGCGSEGIPAIYARVAPYMDWIEGQICALSSYPPDWCSTWTPSGSWGNSGSGGGGALEVTADTPPPTENTNSDSAGNAGRWPTAALFGLTLLVLFVGPL